jgi:hypothetical protein
MTIVFQNPWTEIGICMVIATYVLYLWWKGRFKTLAAKLRTSGFRRTMVCSIPQIVWSIAFLFIAFWAALALVVGIHPLFVGITVNDSGLTLNYSWPRSNVVLGWSEVSAVNIEQRETGVWRKSHFRVCVESTNAIYVCAWITREEAVKGQIAVRRHLKGLNKPPG